MEKHRIQNVDTILKKLGSSKVPQSVGASSLEQALWSVRSDKDESQVFPLSEEERAMNKKRGESPRLSSKHNGIILIVNCLRCEFRQKERDTQVFPQKNNEKVPFSLFLCGFPHSLEAVLRTSQPV